MGVLKPLVIPRGATLAETVAAQVTADSSVVAQLQAAISGAAPLTPVQIASVLLQLIQANQPLPIGAAVVASVTDVAVPAAEVADVKMRPMKAAQSTKLRMR